MRECVSLSRDGKSGSAESAEMPRETGAKPKLSWRPHKTLRTTGKLLSIAITPAFQEALAAMPAGTRADGVLTVPGQ